MLACHPRHSEQVHVLFGVSAFLLHLRFRHSSMARPHIAQFGYLQARLRYSSRSDLDLGASCVFNNFSGRTPQREHFGNWHSRQRAPRLAEYVRLSSLGLFDLLSATFFCVARLKAENGNVSKQTQQVMLFPCHLAGRCSGTQ